MKMTLLEGNLLKKKSLQTASEKKFETKTKP
jgi:hypothetical protein